ncbi:THAP domain-containing protein [Ooceraea biroi]|uniref:THAP domain-containing protein n=1 Tax=Ooceraea biroi TaxID=2015173 RepID=A0A026X1G5_OOCBI|nr:THAP domain-containing protein [Ooceraea biroi]
MTYCVVSGCNNRINTQRKNWQQRMKENNDPKISFHLIPKDVIRRDKWLEAIYLKNWHPNKTAAVCSEHFKEEDYKPHLTLRKLKEDAVPYLSTKIQSLYGGLEKANQKPESISIAQDPEDIEVDKETSTCNVRSIGIQNTLTVKHESTYISPRRNFNSPSKVRLRKIHAQEIKLLKRKLYDATYNKKKSRKVIHTLKTVLKELRKRNFITTSESDIL